MYTNNYYGINSAQAIPNKRRVKAYIYDVESVVTDTTLNVDVVKKYLGIPLNVSDRDVYLGSLIVTARVIFEQATGITLLLTDFLTYRDNFCNKFFVLGRRPFKEMTGITYINKTEEVKTVDASVYYTIKQYPYEMVRLLPDKTEFTSESLYCVENNIKIRFKAGLSDANGVYSEDVKTALLAIISGMYTNRGDCQSSTNIGSMTLPVLANTIIAKYTTHALAHAEYLEDKLELSNW